MLIEMGETGVILFLIEQFRGHVFSCLKVEIILGEFFVETPSGRTVMGVAQLKL